MGWNGSLLLKEQYKKSLSERFTEQEAISLTLKRGEIGGDETIFGR